MITHIEFEQEVTAMPESGFPAGDQFILIYALVMIFALLVLNARYRFTLCTALALISFVAGMTVDTAPNEIVSSLQNGGRSTLGFLTVAVALGTMARTTVTEIVALFDDMNGAQSLGIRLYPVVEQGCIRNRTGAVPSATAPTKEARQ